MSTEKVSSELSSSASSSSSSISSEEYSKNNNNNKYEKKGASSETVDIKSGAELNEHKTNKSQTNQHVAFCNFIDEEPEEKRKKYLTAKYGHHQMALIKKRLQVEMWLYEKLQNLSNNQNIYNDDLIDVDLDVLLDIEDDQERREWLETKLELLYKLHPSDKVINFIEEIMDRVRLL